MKDNALEIVNDVTKLSNLTVPEICTFIADLEVMARDKIAADPELNLDIPLKNHFSKGVYAREIFIPKGSFIIGKIHKYQNLNILSKGDLSILSIEGAVRVQAPFTIVSTPGVKRVAYAHEDSVWTTVHGTDETDVNKIEEIFIAKDYKEVPELQESIKKLQGEL